MAEKIIPANLPAGHSREEAKKAVADQQAEEIEKLSENMGGFDPSTVFEVENEIAQNYNLNTNEFEVVDAVEGYSYLWGRISYKSHNEIMSRAQRYLGNRVPGYELVSGPKAEFPECWNLRQADGTRRIGDVQLYRVRAEVYRAIRARQDLTAQARHLGISTAAIIAHAERYPRYVHVTETKGNPIDYIRERARSRGGIPREAFDREMVQSLAVHQMAEDAKAGNLHGLPMERAVRKNK